MAVPSAHSAQRPWGRGGLARSMPPGDLGWGQAVPRLAPGWAGLTSQGPASFSPADPEQVGELAADPLEVPCTERRLTNSCGVNVHVGSGHDCRMVRLPPRLLPESEKEPPLPKPACPSCLWPTLARVPCPCRYPWRTLASQPGPLVLLLRSSVCRQPAGLWPGRAPPAGQEGTDLGPGLAGRQSTLRSEAWGGSGSWDQTSEC